MSSSARARLKAAAQFDKQTDNVSLESIHQQAHMIALESDHVGLDLKSLPKRLPAFVSDVKNFFATMLGKGAPTMMEVQPDKDLVRYLKKVDYMNVEPLRAYVPAGLAVSYGEYLDILEQGMDAVEHLLPGVLAPTQTWINTLLSFPEKLDRSKEIPEYNKIDLIPKRIEENKEASENAFGGNTTSDQTTLGQVIENNKAWEQNLRRLEKLNERFARVDRKDIVESVEQISTSLDTLLDRIYANNPEDAYTVSGKTMKQLSDTAYRVAEHIEFYAVYSFELQRFSQAVLDTQEFLKEKLEL